jgi:Carboxypeptidase regulatory-like domain
MTNHFRFALCICIPVVSLLISGCSGSAPPARQAEATKATTPAKPVLYFKVDPATSGTVTGKIVFTGKAPARKKIDMDEDPLCAKQHKSAVYDDSVEVGHKGALVNAFVYIKTGLEGKKFEPSADPVVIDQHGCWFIPRVIGMEAGQALKAVNSDPITHNIHPRAKINREWNQNQPEGAEPAIRKFAWPEVMIRVKCNIHSWMHAFIGVVDNPYFAVSKEDGKYSIGNLPPGTYTIGVWQEGLGTQEQQVTVAPHSNTLVNLTFKGK